MDVQPLPGYNIAVTAEWMLPPDDFRPLCARSCAGGCSVCSGDSVLGNVRLSEENISRKWLPPRRCTGDRRTCIVYCMHVLHG